MIVCKDVAAATVDLYKKYLKKACNLLMPVMLVVYSLLLVNQGITVTDTGYNYGNFVNFDSLDGMWKFSTYLANATGTFFTHLPGGQTMLGLNLYTGLVKALIALVTYFVCVRVFEIPRKITFLAELMALGYCWCPTALLYNYITYLLFTLGAMFLCVAVKTEKDYWYIPAGVCLGLNVMVRLPNLAEMALILAVWFICFVQKVKLPRVLKKTGCCILGYLAGVCVVLAYIVVRYGLCVCGGNTAVAGNAFGSRRIFPESYDTRRCISVSCEHEMGVYCTGSGGCRCDHVCDKEATVHAGEACALHTL